MIILEFVSLLKNMLTNKNIFVAAIENKLLLTNGYERAFYKFPAGTP